MKRILALVLTMVLVAYMFTGCGETKTAYDSEKDAVVEVAFADLVQIPGYGYLYYSTTTRTVYYCFRINGGASNSTGYMAPYILDGHFCEYLNGEIVEIIPTTN